MPQPSYSHPVDASTYDSADPFGRIRRRTGLPHLGSDYRVGAATEVHAIADGWIVASSLSRVLGNVVGVQCVDGVFHGYAHLEADGPQQLSDVVSRGDVIGWSGNTGSASLGDHLHVSMGTTFGAIYGVGFGSTLVDPFARIQSLLGAPAVGRSFLFAEPPGDPMFRIIKNFPDESRDFIVGLTGKETHIKTAEHYNLLKRFMKDTSALEKMFPAERKIIAAYLKKVNS